MSFKRLIPGIVLLISGLCATPAQQPVSQSIVEALQDAVFEVVARKPDPGELSYASELPLELIPFSIRSDAFISMGTAFAVSPTEFLTAAHVLSLEEPTLRDDLYLRDMSGNTFRITSVLKYDSHRDYALISAEALQVDTPLQINTSPATNTTVYAVGNALGEGVIIRDGLLTSRSAEQQNGEWDWLRYSAASSPGNSGGPLLSADGTVIGVITAKSESENLNYALPAEEFLPLAPSPAYVRLNIGYGLPSLNAQNRRTHEWNIDLPLEINELRAAAVAFRNESLSSQFLELLSENEDEIFPADASGQRRVLWSNPGSQFPLMVSERDDSSWQFVQPEEIYSSELDSLTVRYGSLSGDTFFLMESDQPNAFLDQFAEPGLFLESLLSGYPLTRTVGSEEVRITSLGEPYSTGWSKDQWGRRWLSARWTIPFADYGLILYATPTPSGAAGFFATVPSSNVLPYALDFSFMINLFYASYSGSFAQWNSFLGNNEVVPDPLSGADLRYSPDQTTSFESRRVSVGYGPELLEIGDGSSLFMLLSFKPGRDGVVLDISGLYFYGDRRKADRIAVVQHFPAASESDRETTQTWENLLARRHPYNRTSILSGSETHMLGPIAPLQVASAPNSIWTVGLSAPGDVERDEMEQRFLLLEQAVEIGDAETADLTGELSFTESVSLADQPLGTVTAPEISIAHRRTGALAETESVEVQAEPQDTGAAVAATADVPEAAADPTPAPAGPAATEPAVAEHVIVQPATTDLLVALQSGDTDSARLIMLRRPPVYERTTGDGESALMLAARFAPSLVAALIEHGATINLRSNAGQTPLHYAVLGGNEAAARELLQNGADPDRQDDNGRSARDLSRNADDRLQKLFASY